MTDDALVANDGGSGETNSDLSASEDGEVSSDSSDDSVESLDHDLSDHSWYKNMFNPDFDESRYSGTASETLVVIPKVASLRDHPMKIRRVKFQHNQLTFGRI